MQLLVGLAAATVFALAAAASSLAATSQVTITTGQRSGSIQGAGHQLTNKPGGYYMGFIAAGQSFTRNTVSNPTNSCSSPASRSKWAYRGSNCSDYLFGQVNGSCFWVGPRTATHGLRAWWTSRGTAPGNVCGNARRSHLMNPYNFGHMFNCWAGNARNHYNSAGEWPSGVTPLSAERLFYRSADWLLNPQNKRQYLISNATDYIMTLPAGAKVQYRYSTLDDGFDAVYLPGSGWGFIQHGAIDRYDKHIRGKWTVPGNTGWPRKTCRADF